MPDDLQYYYEQELAYLRQMGAQFKEKYPKAASRLMLEPAQCEDPHVERLLEAFAFLAARVHLKIDDEFPEITEALLGIVYPHLTRPVPSMSVVEFRLDLEQGKLSTGLPIPRDSVLRSRPGTSVDCTFRTCYDTTLWPISVSVAEWKTPDRLLPAIKASDYAGALRLDLRQRRVDVGNDDWRQPKADLVAEQDARVGHQGAADGGHLLLTAGQRRGRQRAPLRQHRK